MSDVCVSGLGRQEFVAAWRGLAAREVSTVMEQQEQQAD
jgi:hypothetical protein